MRMIKREIGGRAEGKSKGAPYLRGEIFLPSVLRLLLGKNLGKSLMLQGTNLYIALGVKLATGVHEGCWQ